MNVYYVPIIIKCAWSIFFNWLSFLWKIYQQSAPQILEKISSIMINNICSVFIIFKSLFSTWFNVILMKGVSARLSSPSPTEKWENPSSERCARLPSLISWESEIYLVQIWNLTLFFLFFKALLTFFTIRKEIQMDAKTQAKAAIALHSLGQITYISIKNQHLCLT